MRIATLPGPCPGLWLALSPSLALVRFGLKNYSLTRAGGWPTFTKPQLRLPHPSRFSKGEHHGRWARGPLKPSFGLSGNLPISFITSARCPASLTLFLCHARIIPDRGSEACARLQRRQALPNSRFKIRAGNKCSLTFWILPSRLDKLIGTKRGPSNKK